MKQHRKRGAPSGQAMNTPPRPSDTDHRWMIFPVCLFLAAAVWMVFGQTLNFGFVNYDDNVYVYQNPAVQRGLTWAGVRWAFTYGQIGHWHPLTWLSHMLDCQIYGLNAGGHHLTNVLLHTASVILLFLVLRQMTGAVWRSAFVAAVFAVHPLHVESVAWVAERKDVLSGFFFMLTLWSYVRYVRRPCSVVRYSTVVIVFALGLLSKNMLVTLPFVLLLLDFWPLGRTKNEDGVKEAGWLNKFSVPARLALEKVPLFVLTAASCIITLLAPEKVGAGLHLPFALRMENAVVSYVTYLGQMICPTGLACFYPNPTSPLPLWEVVGALGLLLGISGAVFVFRKKHPWLIVGWLWYLGMLVPVIGLVQAGAQAMADRYTYLPQIGIYVAVSWAAAESAAKWQVRRFALGSLMAVILAGLMVCAWKQTAYWKNSETLWTRDLAVTSNNTDAHNNLGDALAQRGQVDKAISEFQKALAINPNDAVGHMNLGYVLVQSGQADEAISEFQKALAINPNDAEPHNDLGYALVQKGQVDQAIVEYQRALAINSNFDQARNNLGSALLQEGKVDEAIVEYQNTLAINPNFDQARDNLGDCFLRKGRVDEAILEFQKALAINPNFAQARFGLGSCLLQKGQVDGAILEYQEALAINPNFAQACYNLGNCFLQKRQVDKAIIEYQRALAINPDYAQACNNLGNALAQKGQLDQAIIQFQKALAIDPGYPDASHNLHFVLAQKEKNANAPAVSATNAPTQSK